jgi:carbamate kinase
MSDRASEPPVVVVALGGNAMQEPSGDDSVESDFARTQETAEHLVNLLTGHPCRLVITHGNGPQVGNHLLRSELGHQAGDLPLLPLEVCVADTQGGMGYMLQQCIGNALQDAGLAGVVASVVTQVLVDASDPAFQNPSKPVGEMIPADKVNEMKARGWALSEDKHRGGWRRLVASPDPQEIVEAEAVRALLAQGVVVIAGGGGGISVVHDPDGGLRGVPAVIDKDLAAALLAVDLRAEALLILTDVEHAMLGFDTPEERPIEEIDVGEARRHLESGEFGVGSMGPKVEAACRFAEATGNTGIITSIAASDAALAGGTGTRIRP